MDMVVAGMLDAKRTIMDMVVAVSAAERFTTKTSETTMVAGTTTSVPTPAAAAALPSSMIGHPPAAACRGRLPRRTTIENTTTIVTCSRAMRRGSSTNLMRCAAGAVVPCSTRRVRSGAIRRRRRKMCELAVATRSAPAVATCSALVAWRRVLRSTATKTMGGTRSALSRVSLLQCARWCVVVIRTKICRHTPVDTTLGTARVRTHSRGTKLTISCTTPNLRHLRKVGTPLDVRRLRLACDERTRDAHRFDQPFGVVELSIMAFFWNRLAGVERLRVVSQEEGVREESRLAGTERGGCFYIHKMVSMYLPVSYFRQQTPTE
mmetsp:Transcript_2153/g.5293  ORF Transcript_2153/g.5293 Transcript_2153/m.5293 type:complete len:321 (+) Transcript_2153:3-965(+)